MYWIGITGGIASGKSSFCHFLKQNKIAVISADEIVHKLLHESIDVQKQILKEFGGEVFEVSDEHKKDPLQILKLIESKQVQLSRPKLGNIIFSNQQKKIVLESILHPLVRAEANKFKDNQKSRSQKIAFYEIPLLFETNAQKEFDKIIVISTSIESQLQRMQQSRGISREQAMLRIQSQLDLTEKVKQADYVVYNDTTYSDFLILAEEVLQKIQQDLNIA